METVLLIAAGGALGAVCRYGVTMFMLRWGDALPLGTAVVNVAGSFAAGLMVASLAQLHPLIRPLVLTGFLGAFTTMSAWTVECISLFQSGRLLPAGLHLVSGVILPMLAAAAGMAAAAR